MTSPLPSNDLGDIRFAPGHGVLLTSATSMVYTSNMVSDLERIEALLAESTGTKMLFIQLVALRSNSFPDTDLVVCVGEGERVATMVLGQTAVTVTTAASTTLIDPTDSSFVIERLVEGALQRVEVGAPADRKYRSFGGMLPVSSFEVAWRRAAHSIGSTFEASPTSESVVRQDLSSNTPEQAAPEYVEPEYVAPEYRDTIHVAFSNVATNVTLDVSETKVPPTAAATPPVRWTPTPAPLPPTSSGTDPATDTGYASELTIMRDGDFARTPAVAMVGEAVQTSEEVLGSYCSAGHFTDSRRLRCLFCDGETTFDRVELGKRPLLACLRFDTGQVLEVHHPILIGRKPTLREGIAGEVVAFDDDRLLSRDHVEVRLNDWDLVVVDRQSANGTQVVHADGRKVIARPNLDISLDIGSTVLFGAHSFVVEAPARSD